jgi:phage I-like protein
MQDFLFAEFAEGQPVEFLRVGTFIDAHGQEVVISEEVLDALVANFEAAQAGQEVPIDVEHKRSEAAGWVSRVWRDGDRLLASVDWNELGERMVGERVYRYLSATIDKARRVLRSISLVNFPAVKGLRPVELSEGVVGIELQEGLLERIVEAIRGVFKVAEAAEDEGKDDVEVGETESEHAESANGDDEVNDEEDEMSEKLREQIRQEILTELEAEQQTRAELREQVRAEVEAELREAMDRRQELAEFAAEICGGEAGLSTDPDELVELMAGMDDEALATFQGVLKAKVVDFSETGSSRDGNAGKQALSAELAEQVRAWVADGQPLAEWFELNADVVDGEMAEFDLSEFEADEG